METQSSRGVDSPSNPLSISWDLYPYRWCVGVPVLANDDLSLLESTSALTGGSGAAGNDYGRPIPWA